MENFLLEEFQYLAEEQIRRNSSLLDLMTKLEGTNGKINRAISKAVTQCGCIRFLPATHTGREKTVKERAQMQGGLCDSCREELERALGEHLFYLAALLNPLDLSFYDVLFGEMNRQRMLGKYSLR